MALNIITSNRMELLIERLAAVVKMPLADAFIPEIIVVQSKGMQRWLAMELARKLGVWANARYPFPNALIDRLFASIIPDCAEVPETSPFHPDVLTWRIMELLPRHLHESSFQSVAAYLADDDNGLKLLQLAGVIADTYDQYTIYRADMVSAWEKGESAGWQASLWRELAISTPRRHRAALLSQFRRQLARGKFKPADLPRRISLIGISSLPPFHLEVLAAIARHTEVNLFLLNPCRQYWGGIVPERALPRTGQQEFDFSGSSGYFETGNPLLASFGRTGRDFFEILMGAGEDVSPEESFTEPGEDSLLHLLQGDILDLRDRRHAATATISPSDDSLRIHACHSPMREVEVLYDQLLHLLDRNPSLAQRDILVMTPDIESYAPYISAVFGSPERAEERIPFSIADRSLRREGEAAETFLAILDLFGSRFTVTQVLNIVEKAPVLRRFGLAAADMDLIRQWLSATNIRWGIDAGTRNRNGLPPFDENSWRAGLDRLLLGYAMAGNDREFFAGMLPYDHVEGADTVVLGRFLELWEALSRTVGSMGIPRTLPEWAAELRLIASTFIAADDTSPEDDLGGLLRVLDLLETCGTMSRYTGSVGIAVIRSWLGEKLDRQQRGFGFLTGGVTFCAMLPMRSIPFRVICLMGMNDGVFPRRNRKSGFDLMAAAPRRGDRNQRDEDRYLFLEALLSARDHFHISYVGRSIKDNSTLPPSPLVGELIDYCSKAFRTAGREYDDRTMQEALCVDHPLQPFSERYFCPGNGQLFSYSRENRLAAFASPSAAEPVPFLVGPLPKETDTVLNISELVDFFVNPCRHLLQRQLGVSLELRHEAMKEEESFILDPLGKYALEQEMVARLVEDEDLTLHRAAAICRGILPPGEPGLVIYDRSAAAATEFSAQVTAVASGPSLPPLEIAIDCCGVRLVGRIERIWPTGLVHYRYAKLKAKDRLRMWIEYLCLNFAATENYPCNAFLLGSDGILTGDPVSDSHRQLEQLLAIYGRGIAAPLHFFPETSLEYAKKAADPKKGARALADAAKKWQGSEEYPGEKSDPWFQRCFGDGNPLDDEFIELATAVYAPLLAHLCGKKIRKEGGT
ncbi:exodeoxyribonuclease V subunit gamma [Geotalea sp. SG265]|uniref:exodeoxyribonuclease V subunit gamma n=1 Tax=Geotalea sp. SG265 TaxID=2922867 RepID=UPI001FAF0C67|nr:exodeoxyribonuclease V subunit gamma [Geotalea sp. SG265]